MRFAEANKHWQDVCQKEYPTKVCRFNSNCCNLPETDFKGIITICGANASGKSSLLKLISPRYRDEVSHIPLLNGIEITGIVDKNVINLLQNTDLPCLYINSAEEITDILSETRRILPNITEAIDQTTPINPKADELILLSYVLNCQITGLNIYEVERQQGIRTDYSEHQINKDDLDEIIPESTGVKEPDDEAVNDVFPYFVLSYNGCEYGTEALSHGELSILFFYWKIFYKISAKTILLIDEPESFLAPACQKRFCDMLASRSIEKKLQIIFATHSSAFVKKAGISNTIVIRKSDRGIEFQAPTRESECLRVLGLEITKSNIVFVEDSKGKRFLEKIVSQYGSSWLEENEIIFLNGEGNIKLIQSALRKYTGNVRISAIFDADQKGKVDQTNSSMPIYYLPGKLPPEDELIKVLMEHLDEFSSKISVHKVTIHRNVSELIGINSHDFFEKLSQNIYNDNSRVITMFDAAFALWIRHSGYFDECNEFIRAIDPDLSTDCIAEVAKIIVA